MPKIPDCDRCSLYAHDPHLVCAVHPDGVETDKCSDFRPRPNAELQKQWRPQGYSWYGNELISNRTSLYSQEEQLEILNNHPFFTGACPKCRYRFDESLIHYK